MQQNYGNQSRESLDMNQNSSQDTLEQQIKSLSYRQNSYGNTGLEVIQESERSSVDNNQHLEFNERRQILKDSVKGDYHMEDYRGMEDDGTFAQQQQKVVSDQRTVISQLESDLIKERAKNEILRKEVEKRGGNPQVGSSFSNDDVMYQVESLALQLQQKEQIIQRLSQQLEMRNSNSDTQNLQHDLLQFNNKIQEMEEQIVKFSLENERLNSVLNEKNKIIQMYSQARQEDFESAINDQTSKYQGQVDKALQENESLILEIEKLTLINQQLEENNRKQQLKQQEKTEEIRLFWKEHFQKAQQEMQIRLDREKKELIQQIDIKNNLNNQLQQQLRINTGFLAEKSQLQSQIDTQLILSKNMDTQIKDYQSTIERQRKELFDREKQLYEIQSHVTLVERKLVELQAVNNSQNEQLNRLAQIEKQANSIIEENKKLQEIAISKDHQAKLSQQEAENERIQKENIAQRVQKEWEDVLQKEKDLYQAEYDKLNQEKSKLIDEIAAHIAQQNILQQNIYNLEQQISILEEDKEKLLVIVSDKAILENELQVSIDRNTDLELKLTQLLENNKILNQNLNSRINEVNIWVQRFEKAQDENQRINEKYQKQIKEINLATEEELRRGKEKFDQNMAIINNQMSKLEEQLNQFQIEKVESESLIRKEYREKIDQIRTKSSELNEQVTLLQQCLVELQQKHVIKEQEQKETFDKEIEKLQEQNFNQNQQIQELKRQIQIKKQQEEDGKQERVEQFEQSQEKQYSDEKERQAEPHQYVLFEEQQTIKQRNEDGRRQYHQKQHSQQYSYQLFDPNEHNRAISHHSQMGNMIQPPPHQYPMASQVYYPNNPSSSNGFEGYQQSQQQDDQNQLKLTIQKLQQENKQLLLAKVSDYNSFQEQLRSITNSAYLGKSPSTDYYQQQQLFRSPPY